MTDECSSKDVGHYYILDKAVTMMEVKEEGTPMVEDRLVDAMEDSGIDPVSCVVVEPREAGLEIREASIEHIGVKVEPTGMVAQETTVCCMVQHAMSVV